MNSSYQKGVISPKHKYQTDDLKDEINLLQANKKARKSSAAKRKKSVVRDGSNLRKSLDNLSRGVSPNF